MHIYAYIYICIYIYMHMYMYIYIYIYISRFPKPFLILYEKVAVSKKGFKRYCFNKVLL